jgi:hypothetical protein
MTQDASADTIQKTPITGAGTERSMEDLTFPAGDGSIYTDEGVGDLVDSMEGDESVEKAEMIQQIIKEIGKEKPYGEQILKKLFPTAKLVERWNKMVEAERPRRHAERITNKESQELITGSESKRKMTFEEFAGKMYDKMPNAAFDIAKRLIQTARQMNDVYKQRTSKK